MSPRSMLLAAAVLGGLAVALGAFAAHALEETLVERGQLETWRTAVRYQMWHALALLGLAVLAERRPGLGLSAWAFLCGTVLFSGSIYCLCFDVLRPVMIPLTPLGGTLLLLGWLGLGLRSRTISTR